jgi:hypothetical protein
LAVPWFGDDGFDSLFFAEGYGFEGFGVKIFRVPVS